MLKSPNRKIWPNFWPEVDLAAFDSFGVPVIVNLFYIVLHSLPNLMYVLVVATEVRLSSFSL